MLTNDQTRLLKRKVYVEFYGLIHLACIKLEAELEALENLSSVDISSVDISYDEPPNDDNCFKRKIRKYLEEGGFKRKPT